MSSFGIDYSSTEEVFNVRIEDTSGAILEKWKFMKKDFPRWARIISEKYGISLKKPSDLDWTNY